MAKYWIGGRYGSAKLDLDVQAFPSSSMELHVGEGYDMSVTEIDIIEREESDVVAEISQLRDLVSKLQAEKPDDQNGILLAREAEHIAETAKRVVDGRKWYSISAKGLLEAAKAVGEAASPMVASAIKIIELLQKAKV